MATKRVPSVSSEFEGLDLGDKRLNVRGASMAEAITREPALSLPKIFGDGAELEGAYRFLGNEAVEFDDLIRPHVARTMSRIEQSSGTVLIVHDTSEFKFGGEYRRDGLGWLPNGGQGFFAHLSLAASYDEKTDGRDPLGLVGVQTIFREAPRRSSSSTTELESKRWPQGIERAEEVVAGHCSVVHVADRESDAYEVLSLVQTKSLRFVLRSNHNRTTTKDGATQPLWDAVGEQPSLAITLEASVSARRPGELGKGSKAGKAAIKPSAATGRTLSARTAHPARTERNAILHVSAGKHVILRPDNHGRYRDCPKQISLNVVRVFEPNPPEGVEPIEWLLFTSEPISTPEEVTRIINWYRARWIIEEFFKALKTGGAFEKLQLESRTSILNAFALYLPIAWQLLRLRSLARTTPQSPASEVLTPLQITALRALSKKALPAELSVQDALLAIAAIGGHLKRNGPPGWIVLARGFHDVLIVEAALEGAGVSTSHM